MSKAMIINAIAKRTLGNVAIQNINSKDPFFEEVPVYDRHGRATGKVRKQKRNGVPEGLSQHDARVLKKVRRRAYRLDMGLFNCCGFRAGWSSLIAFIPVIGDAIDCLMAILVYRTCCGVEGGLPSMIQARMFANICIDFLVGLVPFIGDVGDIMFRANTRNAWILEEYLSLKAQEEKKQGRVLDGEDAGKNSAPRFKKQSQSSSSQNPGSGRGSSAAQNAFHVDEEIGLQDMRPSRQPQGRQEGRQNRGSSKGRK